MIKIECTREEQSHILTVLVGGNCFFPDMNCSEKNCYDCLKKNIKWEILPDPCPCCGGEAKLCLAPDSKRLFVRCEICELRTNEYDTEDKAKEIWNKRADIY